MAVANFLQVDESFDPRSHTKTTTATTTKIQLISQTTRLRLYSTIDPKLVHVATFRSKYQPQQHTLSPLPQDNDYV